MLLSTAAAARVRLGILLLRGSCSSTEPEQCRAALRQVQHAAQAGFHWITRSRRDGSVAARAQLRQRKAQGHDLRGNPIERAVVGGASATPRRRRSTSAPKVVLAVPDRVGEFARPRRNIRTTRRSPVRCRCAAIRRVNVELMAQLRDRCRTRASRCSRSASATSPTRLRSPAYLLRQQAEAIIDARQPSSKARSRWACWRSTTCAIRRCRARQGPHRGARQQPAHVLCSDRDAQP